MRRTWPTTRRDAGRTDLARADRQLSRGRRRHPLGGPALRPGRRRGPVRPARRARRPGGRAARRRRDPPARGGPGPHLAPSMAGSFRHRALFVGANARVAVAEGRADYVPTFLSDVPRLFSSGTLPLDAVLLHVSPPDAHGFCSLGTSVEAVHAARAAATVVIAQINPRMPRTLGESFVHVDEIDLGVEVDADLPEHHPPAIGPVEERIGDLRRRAHPRSGDDPAGHRGDPRGDRPGAARPCRPGRPHRDVHGWRRRSRRGRRHHRCPQGAQRGQDRHDLPDGHPPPVRLRPRQPDGRDAPRRVHQRPARHPHRSRG